MAPSLDYRRAPRTLPLAAGVIVRHGGTLMARTSWRYGFSICALVMTGCVNKPARDANSPTLVAEDIGRTMALIDAEYADVVPRERLYRGAVRGMLTELDPHSSYFDPQEFKELQEHTSGSRVGIGVELDLRGGRVRVIAPVEGAPAFRAGVRPGDELLAVDGHAVEIDGADKVLRRLRGDAGSQVRLKFRRGAATLDIALTREALHFDCASSKTLANGIWYLRIRSFQQQCHEEVMRAWKKAAATKPARILLDMRSNPGGLVTEAVALADEWLEQGDIVSLYARGELRESSPASSGGAFVGIPTVVLLNRWSASASEILAGALKDAKAARIVGEQSYGKGTVQAVVALPSGGGMALTIARYTTPSGRYIQGQGIVPEVQFEQAAAADAPPDMPRESEIPGALAAPKGHQEKPLSTVRLEGVRDGAAPLSDEDTWARAALGLFAERAP